MSTKKEPQKIARPVVINGLGGRKIVEEYDSEKHGVVEPVVGNRRAKALGEAPALTPVPISKKKKKD